MLNLMTELQNLIKLQQTLDQRIRSLEIKIKSNKATAKERHTYKSLKGQAKASRAKISNIKTSYYGQRRSLNLTKGQKRQFSISKRMKKGTNIKMLEPIKKIRPATPLDGLITNKGVATSIYNAIQASNDPSKYMEITRWMIQKDGERNISNYWIKAYFAFSVGYDNATDNFIHDRSRSTVLLEEWERQHERAHGIEPKLPEYAQRTKPKGGILGFL